MASQASVKSATMEQATRLSIPATVAILPPANSSAREPGATEESTDAGHFLVALTTVSALCQFLT